MIQRIVPGKCYRLGGRAPIVVKSIEYGTGKRTTVTGFTPFWYKQYMKFHTIDPDTLKTVAELEGIAEARTVKFRVNSTSKIEEVDVRLLFPNEPWINTGFELGELKHLLSLPRRAING